MVYVRFLAGAVLVGMMVVLAGCNGARESEEIAYIIAVGIDKGEEAGKIKVTYQVARPNVEGNKGEGKADTVLITNSAATLAESLNLLKSSMALTPSLSQVKVLVVGQDLARQGVDDMWGAFKRYREYRGSMFILIARGTAQELLGKIKPSFNISASKYFETMLDSGKESGYYLRVSFHQFYIRLQNHSLQPYATLVDFSPSGSPERTTQPKSPGSKVDGYFAGEIPFDGGNPVQFAGTAVFTGAKMTGILTTTETRMLSMLLGEYRHGFLSVEDPLDPQYFVNVNLRLGATPDIRVEFKEDGAVIHVKVLLEGDISNIPSGINYEQGSYLKLLEEQINRVCYQDMSNMIRHTQELHSDVAGFGYYIRPLFKNYQEYLDNPWSEQYSRAKVDLVMETKIRRTGLMIRTNATQ